MTGPHFNEIVETVRLTTDSTKGEIAKQLGVCEFTLYRYRKFGVPLRKTKFVMGKLRKFLFDNLGA